MRARIVRLWIGILLLAVGLAAHLRAARGMGGYYIAYRDHILGFVLLTVVAGAIIAGLGRLFWRGRHDVTVLILGIVQAVLGVAIYLIFAGRYHIH